jgi:hypothetical protein
MKTGTWLTIARYALTGVIAGLSAAYAYYPHLTAIPIALAVLATIGIHVVPSAPQMVPPVKP